MNWRAEVKTKLCTGSWTTAWANARPINTTDSPVPPVRYETAECWFCGDRIPLQTTPRDHLVLAPHGPTNAARQSEERGPR